MLFDRYLYILTVMASLPGRVARGSGEISHTSRPGLGKGRARSPKHLHRALHRPQLFGVSSMQLLPVQALCLRLLMRIASIHRVDGVSRGLHALYRLRPLRCQGESRRP